MSDFSSSSLTDFINAVKGVALNTGAAAQAFNKLGSLSSGGSSATSSSVLPGRFTLTASATSTNVAVSGASSSSKAMWSPRTADAANAVPFLFGTCGTNVLNLTHASNSSSDQTFDLIVYL